MAKKTKTFDERIEELKRKSEAAHDRAAIQSCAKETRQQIILGKYLQTKIKVDGTVEDIIKSKPFDLFVELEVDRKLFGLQELSKEEREKRRKDKKEREKARVKAAEAEAARKAAKSPERTPVTY